MRKVSFLKSTFSFVLLLCISILFVNCSSSHNDDDYVPSSGKIFDPADFALTITKKQLNADNLYIGYDIKNTSKISYLDSYEQGNYIVKATAKTTDGTTYQGTFHVKYVEAGVTYPDFLYLDFTLGKTLDLSTLTVVIVRD